MGRFVRMMGGMVWRQGKAWEDDGGYVLNQGGCSGDDDEDVLEQVGCLGGRWR